MALEALGGVMTYQVQTEKPSRMAQNEPNQTDSGLQNISINADSMTAVNKTQESETSGQNSSDSGNGQQSSAEQLKKAINELNKNAANTQVQFGIHEGTNRITLKIIDKDTKKIVREFPAEKTLDMIAKVWELAGILVDEKR